MIEHLNFWSIGFYFKLLIVKIGGILQFSWFEHLELPDHNFSTGNFSLDKERPKIDESRVFFWWTKIFCDRSLCIYLAWVEQWRRNFYYERLRSSLVRLAMIIFPWGKSSSLQNEPPFAWRNWKVWNFLRENKDLSTGCSNHQMHL